MTIRDLFDRLDWTRFRVVNGLVRDDEGRCPLAAAFKTGRLASNVGVSWCACEAGMTPDATDSVMRAADNLVSRTPIEPHLAPAQRERARFDRTIRAIMLRRIRHPSMPIRTP